MVWESVPDNRVRYNASRTAATFRIQAASLIPDPREVTSTGSIPVSPASDDRCRGAGADPAQRADQQVGSRVDLGVGDVADPASNACIEFVRGQRVLDVDPAGGTPNLDGGVDPGIGQVGVDGDVDHPYPNPGVGGDRGDRTRRRSRDQLPGGRFR